MKRTLLLLSLCAGVLSGFAQSRNVESAAIYFRNLEMEDAKKAIDEAAANDETKNDPKMWFYYAQIYDTLYRNPAYHSLDKDIVEKFAIGCKKCLETDAKKRYEYYCGYAIINSAFASYNKAVEFYAANDVKNATRFFQYVMDVFPYDKGKDLQKNNINEKSIIYSLAGLALNNKNYEEAKKNLQKLIDMDYNSHVIYILQSNIYLEQGDTATAIRVIEQGRGKFPGEKDLINQELNIYITQHRQDVLLTKLNDALAAEPDNATLAYIRGNVYDNISADQLKQAKHLRDTAEKVGKKANSEKVPASKTKLQAQAKAFNKSADSLFAQQKISVANAERDYRKAIEVNSEYLDVYYNLGALTNNKTTEIVERMNALSSTAPDYNKKWDALKKVQDSVLNVALGYFIKAQELADALPEGTPEEKELKKENLKMILFSTQQVYANLGNEKKTVETKNRRMLVELPGGKKADVVRNMMEPKKMSKNTSSDGRLIEVWEYDGLVVTMENGVVKEVTLK